jgi:hypothetical protein
LKRTLRGPSKSVRDYVEFKARLRARQKSLGKEYVVPTRYSSYSTTNWDYVVYESPKPIPKVVPEFEYGKWFEVQGEYQFSWHRDTSKPAFNELIKDWCDDTRVLIELDGQSHIQYGFTSRNRYSTFNTTKSLYIMSLRTVKAYYPTRVSRIMAVEW